MCASDSDRNPDTLGRYQHPPGGTRNEEQECAFRKGLDVMGDLYASAVGTAVLQVKEVHRALLQGYRCRIPKVVGVVL